MLPSWNYILYIHIISIFYTIMFPWKFDLDIAGQTQSGHEATVHHPHRRRPPVKENPREPGELPKPQSAIPGGFADFSDLSDFHMVCISTRSEESIKTFFWIFVGYLNIFEPDPKHAVLCFLIPDDIAFTFFDFCQGRSYRGVAYILYMYLRVYICIYIYTYVYFRAEFPVKPGMACPLEILALPSSSMAGAQETSAGAKTSRAGGKTTGAAGAGTKVPFEAKGAIGARAQAWIAWDQGTSRAWGEYVVDFKGEMGMVHQFMLPKWLVNELYMSLAIYGHKFRWFSSFN